MAGYICIAMLEDPPYNMILTATEEEPEDWLDELPLPSHLLCYESFKDSNVILKQFIQRLKADGITAKVDKAFSARPHEVIQAFNVIRDEAVINNQLVEDMYEDDDEGERLYDLAREYKNGNNKIIPDLKKAFKLYMQSAELGYDPAYFSLALAYFNGDGVKKDLNESLKWAMREIESGGIYGYYVAADCFVEAGMKEQASDIWRRCFKEQIHEDLPNVLGTYARHVSEGLVEQVHTKKIAKLFRAVAENEYDRQAYIWLWENQVADSNFDDTNDEDVECLRNAAEQGDAEAQFELGQMYYIGSGVEENDEKAAFWYRKAAEQSNMEAQYWLGKMYELGSGLEQDDEQAEFWYRKATEQGHEEAQEALRGLGVDWVNDDEDKYEQLYELAEEGSALAQANLGKLYYNGDGLDQDDEQAEFWFRKAAEQGNAVAQFALGGLYQMGRGLEQDNEQAAVWFHKAADQDFATAQYSLAVMYANGLGVEQDDEQATVLISKAAELGDVSSQRELGGKYANGFGVEQDDERAVFWLSKASRQGDAAAQRDLGVMYQSGRGVAQDNEEAVFWYSEAADQDYAKAQYNLGVMHANGLGIEQDYEQAVFWYRKADEQNDETAQFNLGVMYYNGEGVIKNRKQAVIWFRKAAKQGFVAAQEALTGLGIDWEST